MLLQNFKSAADLGITELQLSALQKTLVLLETDKLKHVPEFDWRGKRSNEFTGHFNMKAWCSVTDCGTIHCIGGTAEAISGNDHLFDGWEGNVALRELFAPRQDEVMWQDISTAQAATALRSYLTAGKAKWSEAIR